MCNVQHVALRHRMTRLRGHPVGCAQLKRGAEVDETSKDARTKAKERGLVHEPPPMHMRMAAHALV
jgi:hypothetical protein